MFIITIGIFYSDLWYHEKNMNLFYPISFPIIFANFSIESTQ